ncbi:MAG: methylmalonyl-CoA mutase [Hyphomicrobiales bacterium]|jgi:methylmalonyl-CoA mutase|nr:methylmalonyl-CoA mutase [Hyphomicrobiales bacterium]
MPDAEDPAFASEFPAATREQWLRLVDGVLKGAPFDKRLVAHRYDGLAIQPLYARAPAAQPVAARAPGRAWTVMQRVDHPDPAAANEQALHDLENGATGLTLVMAGSLNANGYGLDSSIETLDRVLDGVYLDAGVAIDFNVAAETRDAAKNFAALVKRRGIAPDTIEMRASLNPLGHLAATGEGDWKTIAPAFATQIGELATHGFRGPFAVADGRVIHNAGGSEAQELAFALASAVADLRALEASGIALDAARRMIYFRLAADADQFLTIAKFRSIRKLWARVEQACGLAPAPAHVAAETAWRMMTRRDPYVNILRSTIAVFAAGLGGADAITVLPFTAAIGLPDRFARRVARNTQLVLLEESHLAKVSDPTAGSGGIEDLTQQLCGAAWALFQDIEKAGGAAAALEQGLIQSKVAATRAEREKNVARRKDALTGTSEFPNIHEAAVHVLEVAPQPASGEQSAAALPRIRLAEPFENLRDASDRALAATSSRPTVFLANLGKLSDFTARTLFAKNFFEAGGIEAATNDGFASRDDMIAAFKASGARLVCLCSSDKVYAAEAADAARALTSAGAAPIYLAGRPGELEAALKSAGVQDFIYVGCDVVAVLTRAHTFLSAQRRQA